MIRELREKTDSIIAAVGDQSFYRLSRDERRSRIREVTRLYRSLLRTGSFAKRSTAAAAAASAMLLAGGIAETQEPRFSEPRPNQMGVEVQEEAAYYAMNSLADLDDDGDLDFFSWASYYEGDTYGIVPVWQENVGTRRSPSFTGRVALTELGMPFFDGYDSSGFVIHGMADIDGDGDLDAHGMFPNYAQYAIDFAYVENIGTRRSPQFSSVASRPFSLSEPDTYSVTYLLYARSTMADIDADGDLDLLLGVTKYDYQTYDSGIDLMFFENIGSRRNAEFAPVVHNPFGIDFSGLPYFIYARLEVADLDRDGDYDLLIGGYLDDDARPGFVYLENIGGERNPSFAQPVMDPFGLDQFVSTVYAYAQPVAGDLDGDGDLDLLYGLGDNDKLYYSENLSR